MSDTYSYALRAATDDLHWQNVAYLNCLRNLVRACTEEGFDCPELSAARELLLEE